MSTRLAALALTGVVLLSGCAGRAPDDAAATSGSATRPEAGVGERIEVRVSGGEVTGATGRVPVAIGTEVELVVTSDVADDVHVHGYDLTAPLAAGQPATLTFDATLAGVFEVELHDAGTVLLSLQVG